MIILLIQGDRWVELMHDLEGSIPKDVCREHSYYEEENLKKILREVVKKAEKKGLTRIFASPSLNSKKWNRKLRKKPQQ